MKSLAQARQDQLFLVGLLLIPISLFFFCIPFLWEVPAGGYFGLFIPTYAVTVVYFVMLMYKKRLAAGREGLFPLFIFLILFLISAYALNREIVIFEKTAPWFAGLQVVLCINYIAFIFFDFMPRPIKLLMVFLLGIAVIAFTYLTFYLVPMLAPGLLLSFFLGISTHAFVPVLFLIYTFVLAWKIFSLNHKYWRPFAAGIGFALALVIGFVSWWTVTTQSINKTYRQSTVAGNNGLPGWATVAQTIQQGWMTEKTLKGNLVYSTFEGQGDWLWRMPTMNGFAEEQQHDPLVMIASFFAGKPNLSEENRIKILESMYHSRHQAQERLWSGEDLVTERIKTEVRIWPQFALSYTEKEVIVSNMAEVRGWSDQQEALYTFYLPEGAVVTSLSLWIDGKEEPAILTTKQKADTAYKTIVGVQRRDPSLIHWQEGNTVTVRVFPVVAGESRKFKIGVTAPLTKEGRQMNYENLYFQGPAFNDATEDILLKFEQNPKHFTAPALFEQKGKQGFVHSGKYKPDWSIQWQEEPLSEDAFSFDGKSYTIHPYRQQRTQAITKTLFLDVNKSWTREEFNKVCLLAQNKEIFVYDNEWVPVTMSNRDEVFTRMHKYQFSLFPVHKVKDSAHSLVVSKSAPTSPNIDDLRESRFMQELKLSLATPQKIRLFNIGQHLSPYLRSLKEFRLFQYEHGSIYELGELLNKQVFASNIENDSLVVIDHAAMTIAERPGTSTSKAPDHLLRLFAYNHIMSKLGASLLTDQEAPEALINEAQRAYVVTPVSSLVVLETKKDYEQFNIKDGENSLKNASNKSKGAVPEPHEWALIIIALVVVLVITRKSKKLSIPS